MHCINGKTVRHISERHAEVPKWACKNTDCSMPSATVLFDRREQEVQVEERENQFVIGEAQMVGAERRLNSAVLSKAAGQKQPAAAVNKRHRR